MNALKFGRWLGAGALGTLLVLGCRHARKEECCICPCECCEVVVPVPADAPKKVTPPLGRLPAFDSEPPVVKKDTSPAIHYRAVAPGMNAGEPDQVGTEEMTASDAATVHIRPGYTPGALYIKGKSNNSPAIVEKKPEAEQPAAPKMDIPQKPAQESATPIDSTEADLKPE